MKGQIYKPVHVQSNWWVWVLMFLLPRQKWYREHYLHSEHWRFVRRDKIIKEKGMCVRCEKRFVMFGGNLHFVDVHHLTYKRIWHEKLSDLQVLCRECHKKEHNES